MDERYKDPEFLEEQYVELRKTQGEIGELCGVHESTIYRHINKHKMERLTPKYQKKDFLQKQYVELGKTQSEIGELCNVDQQTIGNWLKKHNIGNRVECEQCGNSYEYIGQHWTKSSCEHPSFTDRQREIITGFLMSDACISRFNKNPYIRSKMITKPFLEWVDEEMGVFGNGVEPGPTAEESAQKCRDTGFSPNAKAENYHDQYRWQSICHPELHEFAAWYDTGKKVWPDSVKLTPLSLKVFFCGDGCFNTGNKTGRIEFSLSNERKNKRKVEKLFNSVGISNGRWNEWSRKDGSINCTYVLNVEQSRKAWEIMGDPLPGFSYKWPEHLRSQDA